MIVVQEESGLGKVAKAAKIYNVPLAFVVCADRDTAWVREFDGKNHTDRRKMEEYIYFEELK